MFKLLVSTTLLFVGQLAFAHEGHPTDAASLFHYFSAPHLFVTASVGIVVAAVWYFSARRRSQR